MVVLVDAWGHHSDDMYLLHQGSFKVCRDHNRGQKSEVSDAQDLNMARLQSISELPSEGSDTVQFVVKKFQH